jgi:hypothetical protein
MPGGRANGHMKRKGKGPPNPKSKKRRRILDLEDLYGTLPDDEYRLVLPGRYRMHATSLAC